MIGEDKTDLTDTPTAADGRGDDGKAGHAVLPVFDRAGQPSTRDHVIRSRGHERVSRGVYIVPGRLDRIDVMVLERADGEVATEQR